MEVRGHSLGCCILQFHLIFRQGWCVGLYSTMRARGSECQVEKYGVRMPISVDSILILTMYEDTAYVWLLNKHFNLLFACQESLECVIRHTACAANYKLTLLILLKGRRGSGR